MRKEDETFVIVTAWQDGEFLLSSGYVVCADGGYDFARRAGAKVKAIVGDMDSISAEELRGAEAAGAEIIRHPKEKDDTDTLLCAKYGLSLGFRKFVIVGGIGGAFSHTMANLQTLSFLCDMGVDARIETAEEILFFIDENGAKSCVFRGEQGKIFSLFSYAERTSGVSIEGSAKYKLQDAVLTQSYPLAVRNEFTKEAADGLVSGEAKVSLGFGRLLVIIEK